MGDFITGNLAADRAQIAVGGCTGREQPSTRRTADGKVQFENANYRITADDNNEILIHNKNTGENYRIWGDPHVEVDGKHASILGPNHVRPGRRHPPDHRHHALGRR